MSQGAAERESLRRDKLDVMICAPAAKRSSVRVGVWARRARKRREDGADDHALNTDSKLASLRASNAGAVSPRQSRINPAISELCFIPNACSTDDFNKEVHLNPAAIAYNDPARTAAKRWPR